MLSLRPSEPSMVPLEIRQQGEYRTRRVVFAAWDGIEVAPEFKAMGM